MNKKTRAFVKQRHQRHRQYTRERWLRLYRRFQHTSFQGLRFLRTWLWLSIAAFVIVGAGVLLFSPLVHVREMRIRRTDPRLDSEKVQRALRPLFGKHLFFLADRTVEGLVRGAMPDVDKVTVEKRYPSELVLAIGLRPLAARLDVLDEQSPRQEQLPAAPAAGTGAVVPAKQTFDYLTDNGLYVALPFQSEDKTLPLLRVVDWAVRPAPSSRIFAPDFLARMKEAEDALRDQFGLKITGRTAYLRAREFHIRTSAFSVWFDMRSPVEEQLQRYRTFLKEVGTKEVREYIDLRLNGRIVYK
ncbi:MAG: hypothetical protein PHW10_02575 [Candidatus Peribacteraceae bacterium]|nr:hypothetical protein [Candidatus Peribacteraceae bacterium]